MDIVTNSVNKTKKENDSIFILMCLSLPIYNNNIPKEIILYIISIYDLLFKNRSYYRIKEEPNFKHLFIKYDEFGDGPNGHDIKNASKYYTTENKYIVYCINVINNEYIEALFDDHCYLTTWDQYILFPSPKRAIYTYVSEKTKYKKDFSSGFLIHPSFIYEDTYYGGSTSKYIEEDSTLYDHYCKNNMDDYCFVDSEYII